MLRAGLPDGDCLDTKEGRRHESPVLVGVPVHYRENHRLMEIVHPSLP